MNANAYEGCTRCGAKVHAESAIWLYYRTSTNTYHTEEAAEEQGWLCTGDDQGGWPFGQVCAERELAEQKQAAHDREYEQHMQLRHYRQEGES